MVIKITPFPFLTREVCDFMCFYVIYVYLCAFVGVFVNRALELNWVSRSNSNPKYYLCLYYLAGQDIMYIEIKILFRNQGILFYLNLVNKRNSTICWFQYFICLPILFLGLSYFSWVCRDVYLCAYIMSNISETHIQLVFYSFLLPDLFTYGFLGHGPNNFTILLFDITLIFSSFVYLSIWEVYSIPFYIQMSRCRGKG